MTVSPRTFWVGMVVGLLGLTVVTQGIGLWLATSDPAFAVEEDYEARAANWDAHRAQLAANEALGWEVDLRVSPGDRRGDANAVARVLDRDGAPIEGAVVSYEAFHVARASQKLRGELSELGAGSYGRVLPLRRDGLWEFRLRVELGDALFTDRARETVATGGAR